MGIVELFEAKMAGGWGQIIKFPEKVSFGLQFFDNGLNDEVCAFQAASPDPRVNLISPLIRPFWFSVMSLVLTMLERISSSRSLDDSIAFSLISVREIMLPAVLAAFNAI